MKIILRILSVAAILIAALFLLVYLAAGVGLWRINQPTTTALVNSLTAVDQVLQKADPVVEKVVTLSGDLARIGNEIGGEQNEFSQTATQVQDQLTTLLANARGIEKTIATTLPRVPTTIDLIWVAATLVLLWLSLAQAALIYLAVLYLRTGRLGQPATAKNTAQLIPVEAQPAKSELPDRLRLNVSSESEPQPLAPAKPTAAIEPPVDESLPAPAESFNDLEATIQQAEGVTGK